MKGNLNLKGDLAKLNLAYEKPLVHVYEMETEGAILQASGNATPGDLEYESSWS